jgi:homoserine dehydrogenase
MMAGKTLKVAMLGCGVVGSQVARLLIENKADLSTRAGANLELVSVAVRNPNAKNYGIKADLLTSDLKSIVSDPQIDLVIEVLGGIEPARELILTALQNGKSVITANKALLAKHGAELYAAADKANVDLYYEAAVAGAIPILRPLRESLVGDEVLKVMGIVNGTTNYILTKMDEKGAAFADALAEAQKLGFAEADPSADVEGGDAAAKAAILASLAFHSRVTDADVYKEGISKITATDVKVAKAAFRDLMGEWSKIGITNRDKRAALDARVAVVEEAIKSAEAELWRKSDPAAKARAADVVAQLTESIANYEKAAAKAEAAGNAKKAKEALESAAARKVWLVEAEKSLAEFK